MREVPAGGRWTALASAVGATVLWGAVPAADAGATMRNAVAQGGATSGDCTTTPCTFTRAVEAAVTDDEIVVHPGDYALASTPSTPLVVNKRVYIHGVEGQPRPRLIQAAGGSGSFVDLTYPDIRLRHLYIEANATNNALHSNQTVTLERLVISARPGSDFALNLEVGSPVVRDTIALSSNSLAVYLQATRSAQLRNVTAYTHDTQDTALGVVYGNYNSDPTQPCEGLVSATATLRNVIARGGGNDIYLAGDPGCNRSATVNIRNSNYRPDRVEAGGATTFDAGGAAGGNQSGDPLFANAAQDDFHLLPGSPAIDAGLADAQNGTTDVDGDPRPLGAAIDIGADEVVPAAPGLPGGATPGSGGALRNVSPLVSGFSASARRFAPLGRGRRSRSAARRRTPRGTTFRYALSEPARVTIVLARRERGRRVRRRCLANTRARSRRRRCTRLVVRARLTASRPAGRGRTRFTGRVRGRPLPRGRYVATITATDPQGARSRPQSLSLRILPLPR